ncbi:MAG: tRNA (5-methylaminomethyl-2-thiouridine)(34)-methyltransferase MnmD [Chitinophagales bacterium]
MKRELVKTEDGSHSLFIKELDEHYHSIYGAIQESKHVFIEAGLKYFPPKSKLTILEIGFGTGLNALTTILANEALQNQINYVGVEAYPVTLEEAAALNYVEELKAEQLQPLFDKMHMVEWERSNEITPSFTLIKKQVKFEDLQLAPNSIDLIYFDAFAPSAQAHLWEESIFSNLFQALKSGGILVTYCAKGVVKRTLKSVGFTLEALPGPKGKREMTRAVK